jgi:small-conductance mechanosensitive channel
MKKRLLWGVVFCAALLFFSVPCGWCAQLPKAKPAPAKEPSPTELTAEQVDPYLATLTDEQARKALGQVLKQSAVEKAGPKDAGASWLIGPAFFGAAQKVTNARERLRAYLSSAAAETTRAEEFFDTLSEQKGWGAIFGRLAVVVAIIGCGLALRRLFAQKTAGVRDQLLGAVRLGKAEFFGRVITRLLLEIVGAVVYMTSTFALFVIFFRPEETGYVFVASYLVVSYYIVLIALISHVIFSHDAPALRLFPMPDDLARFFHRWLLWIILSSGVLAATSSVFDRMGGTRELYLLLYSLAGAFVIFSLVVMVWQKRTSVAQTIMGGNEAAGKTGMPIRRLLARTWHWLAMLYILWMGVDWVAGVILEGRLTLLNLILSIFIIPIFFGLDQWGQRLLKIAAGETPPLIPLTGYPEADPAQKPPEEPQEGLRNYVPHIRRAYRAVLVAFAFFVVLRFWGIDLPLGRVFTQGVFSVIITLALGLIAWQIIKTRIDRKIKDETLAGDEEAAEEGGGPGGSRAVTLLMLLRKFILAVLFVLVLLITLSSIGVDIAPLIAGAGVVGLAIGFGSQTLVKDIIAGIFFLTEDAFRIGDYVEAGSAKGTVVQMSLRSLKMRHPRGMLYNVPFGDLKTVTNFSRDYIITKLDVRLRFDADLEKVRKIIKKINKEIMQDEEYRAALLSDIKSAGVRQIDDSAMIIRVKFKTVPGKQFGLRREIFARLQKAFQTSGIEFAHRNVTVYLPPEIQSKPLKEMTANEIKTLEAGAAAAAAIAQAEEEQKAKAKPEKS